MVDIASGVPISSARDHPEYKYTVTEYNVTNDTKDKITGLFVPASLADQFKILLHIVPINTRAYCNTMGYTEYNDMMVSVSETPTTNSKTFLDLFNRTGLLLQILRIHLLLHHPDGLDPIITLKLVDVLAVSSPIDQNYGDVVFVNNQNLVVKSGN